MTLCFTPVTAENQSRLVDFLPAHPWPFHGRREETPDSVQEKIRAGLYVGEHVETFYIEEGDTLLGFLRLYEMDDPTPIFDLRLAGEARGKGLGKQALTWLARYYFNKYPQGHRLGGYTRGDNQAMQAVFAACGWEKEANHRKAWPGHKGEWYDCVGFGLLREEWANGPDREDK